MRTGVLSHKGTIGVKNSCGYYTRGILSDSPHPFLFYGLALDFSSDFLAAAGLASVVFQNGSVFAQSSPT